MKIMILFFLTIIVFAESSCDKNTPVISIKNQTSRYITGTSLIDDQSIVDSDFYKDHVNLNINLKPGKLQDIGVLQFRFGRANSTTKLHIYLFYEDTLNKYLVIKKHKGVLSKIFKRIDIDLTKLEKKDTIFLKN